MADRTKRKTKKKKKVKVSSKGGTTVNVNVSMSVGARQQPKERVKRIRSRRRPNLREMRQSMPGAGGSRAFANPAFYGNVQMLTNSAMNQFQNQRYSLENQLRESRAEQKALLTAGRAEAAQNQGRETATLQTQPHLIEKGSKDKPRSCIE